MGKKSKGIDPIHYMSPGETLVTPELKRWLTWMAVEHGAGKKKLAGMTGVSMEWIEDIVETFRSDEKFWRPEDGEFDPEKPPVRKGVAK